MQNIPLIQGIFQSEAVTFYLISSAFGRYLNYGFNCKEGDTFIINIVGNIEKYFTLYFNGLLMEFETLEDIFKS